MTQPVDPMDKFIPKDALEKVEAKKAKRARQEPTGNGPDPGYVPPGEPKPARIPYPPDEIWFGRMGHPAGPHYFSRQQENWLRWRDAEEKRRGCPGTWGRK